VAKESPRPLSLGEWEIEKITQWLISPNAGLWALNIGDTEFTKHLALSHKDHRPHAPFHDAFGEEVSIENAEAAVTYACEQPSRDRHLSPLPDLLRKINTRGH